MSGVGVHFSTREVFSEVDFGEGCGRNEFDHGVVFIGRALGGAFMMTVVVSLKIFVGNRYWSRCF